MKHTLKHTLKRLTAMVLVCILAIGFLAPAPAYAASKTPSKVTISSVKTKNASSTSTVTVKWKKAKNAKKYQVYYKYGASSWKAITTTSKSRAIKVSRNSGSTKLYIKVRGINGKKYGKWSTQKTVTIKGTGSSSSGSSSSGSSSSGSSSSGSSSSTTPVTPGTVTGLTIRYTGTGGNMNCYDDGTNLITTASWSAASNAKTYEVYYKYGNTSDGATWQSAGTVSSTSYTFKLARTETAKTFYVKVRGINGSVYGEWSTTSIISVANTAKIVTAQSVELEATKIAAFAAGTATPTTAELTYIYRTSTVMTIDLNSYSIKWDECTAIPSDAAYVITVAMRPLSSMYDGTYEQYNGNPDYNWKIFTISADDAKEVYARYTGLQTVNGVRMYCNANKQAINGTDPYAE